ncbi:MAG: hypothetical protein CMO97_03190 [Woeseia sp.]|nr:hypothetical protein [Woeseia sp.]|tara:strand:+ start:4647 stop:6485 length:1839 start_codon:yes stop_codon:yes gene_type:complete
MELTIGEVLQQGMILHKEGKLRDAENFYRAILRSRPMHSDANHNLGLIAVALNKVDTALPLLKAALDEDSSTEQYWLSYIDALIKSKQYENAKEFIGKAREHEISDVSLNKLKESITLLTKNDKTPDGKPSKEDTQKLIKHCEIGEYNEAKELALSFTKEFPTFQFAWKALGIIFKKLGMVKESLAASRKSVELLPQDPEAQCNLANTLKGLGRLDEAEACYMEAIKIWPEFAAAHNNLGRTLHDLGKLNEAKESFLLAIKSKPDFAAAHNNLGSTLKKMGKLDEASTSFNQAIELSPSFAQAHSNLGNLLFELKRFKEAEDSFRKAIKFEPGHIKAINNLGDTLKKLGKLEDAETSYRDALALNSDIPMLHSNLARVLYVMGQHDAALESIEKANQIDPRSKDFELLLKFMRASKSKETDNLSAGKNDSLDSIKDLNKSPLILNRAPEKKLIDYLYGMKSRNLSIIRNASLTSKAFPLNLYDHEDNDDSIKDLAKDLMVIMEDSVKSEVFISDVFFKISKSDIEETPYTRLTELDEDDGLKLREKKYTMIYYLSAGDQDNSNQGFLNFYEPGEKILPKDGMIVIIPAGRKYSSSYNGDSNRIIIGLNFYSL